MPCNCRQHPRTPIDAAESVGERGRGVAIVLVLGVISITLAMAYALLRTQALNVLIQGNGIRERSPPGGLPVLAAGLQSMSTTGWSGVNTTSTATLSSTDSYSVTFTAGDSSLTTQDPNQPYRVTITSTGYSSSSLLQQSQQASYQVKAVVALSPRQLGTQPTSWSSISQHSLYQIGTGAVTIDPPCQMTSTVHLQGSLSIGTDYAWSSSASTRFFSDLNAMKTAGVGDERPFTGKVYLPTASQSAQTISTLANLGLTVTNLAVGTQPSIPCQRI